MKKSKKTRRWGRLIGRTVVFGLILVTLALCGGYWLLRSSLPDLEGQIAAAVAATVRIERDEAGVPTIYAQTRRDGAYALGFLHAQERFFQMDLQRRSGAGELAELVGAAALATDRAHRLHRFRTRSRAYIDVLTARERELSEAYTEGVNWGLAVLKAKPFEYYLLGTDPEPWQTEDIALTSYAMYFTLQDGENRYEERRAALVDSLGQVLADFVAPLGTRWDAPIDGGMLPEAVIPTSLPPGPPDPATDGSAGETTPGSNNWVIGGAISETGSAIVANDMHLGLQIPNIWYRARLRVSEGGLDITGVTLPGTPVFVVGSNTHVAWGFTNSFIDTADLVLIDWVDLKAGLYQTDDGEQRVSEIEEEICVLRGPCETLIVKETRWGPILPGTDHRGRHRATRWIAHDPGAVNAGLISVEDARSVHEALPIFQTAGMPTQNVVIGDTQGNVAFTHGGPVPNRYGHDGLVPSSWSKGTRGWRGRLGPGDVAQIVNPESGRLWTANARVVSGEMLSRAGYGHYDLGARAQQIRDRLFEKETLNERDMLAIQLDDKARFLGPWQQLLLRHLRSGETRREAVTAAVEGWEGRALPSSTGYRIVKSFRNRVIEIVIPHLTAGARDALGTDNFPWYSRHAESPVWRLLETQPAALLPRGFGSWFDLLEAAVQDVESEIKTVGGLDRYTWGRANALSIRHPLSRAVPFLQYLTDPKVAEIPGDRAFMPRVNGGGFGSSERMVVSPGHEERGIFHMPGGQAGHPLSPYFNKGHDDWVHGRATPFLPGPARWVLVLSQQ